MDDNLPLLVDIAVPHVRLDGQMGLTLGIVAAFGIGGLFFDLPLPLVVIGHEGGTVLVVLELGSNTFVPGFEDQMIGMKAGDERDINITFPEDYHENLAGKAVVFKVKVHEVIETELPELDDEFAKDVSEFDTLDEYKKVIMEELVSQRTKAVEEDFGVNVMTKATENMTCDLPDAMIEERMYSIMNEYDRSLMNQGMRLEEYMRLSGMDPVSFQNIIRPQAEAQQNVS